MKKRLLGAMLLASTITTNVCAQQLKEKLNRAPVAVKTSTGVLVSWRSFSADADDLSFTVYRNGTKIGSNITRKTNLHDSMGKPATPTGLRQATARHSRQKRGLIYALLSTQSDLLSKSPLVARKVNTVLTI